MATYLVTVMQTKQLLSVNPRLTGTQRHRQDHQDKSRCRHGVKEHGTIQSADDFVYYNNSATVLGAPEILFNRDTQSEWQL